METSSQIDDQDVVELEGIKHEPKPTIEEMMEYWRHTRTLRRCDGCSRHMTCWRSDGIAYYLEAVLRICSNKVVREAVRRMQEMKKGKTLGYYALTGEWFEFQEIRALLED